MKQSLKIIVPIFFVIGLIYFILYLQDNFYQKKDSYPIIKSPNDIIENNDTSLFKVFLHSEKEINIIDITIFELEEIIENRIRFEVSPKDTIQKYILGTDLLIAEALYIKNGLKNNLVMPSSKSLTSTIKPYNDTAFIVKKQMIRDYRTKLKSNNKKSENQLSLLLKSDYSEFNYYELMKVITYNQIILEYESPFATWDVVFKTDSLIYNFLKIQNEHKNINLSMSSKNPVLLVLNSNKEKYEITDEMIQDYRDEVITNYLNK